MVRVCDVNFHFWPESALLHSFQHVEENKLMLGIDQKKKHPECDYHFQCFNYITAKQLRNTTIHNWTVSFKSQQMLKVTQTLDSVIKSFHAQGPTLVTHRNTSLRPTEFIFSTN